MCGYTDAQNSWNAVELWMDDIHAPPLNRSLSSLVCGSEGATEGASSHTCRWFSMVRCFSRSALPRVFLDARLPQKLHLGNWKSVRFNVQMNLDRSNKPKHYSTATDSVSRTVTLGLSLDHRNMQATGMRTMRASGYHVQPRSARVQRHVGPALRSVAPRPSMRRARPAAASRSAAGVMVQVGAVYCQTSLLK